MTSNVPSHVIALIGASLILIAAAIDAKINRRRPLWLAAATRIGLFAALTWLVQQALGSPLMLRLHATWPGMKLWAQLVAIGWWWLGARVAVGIVRLLVVLDNRPRETQIVSDLSAGAIYIATALAVINFVFDVPIGGLLATSGVVAIVLGLALQSTLSDVFSGIAVGLERAYKPGDLIAVEGNVEGRVLQIDWRSTQIATLHNSVAVVPNSIIAKSRIENRSAPTPTRSVCVSARLDPRIDPKRCLAALSAAAQACRLRAVEAAPSVRCVSLGGDGILYDVELCVGSSEEVGPARTELISEIHRHLCHAGIGLAIAGTHAGKAASAPTTAELLAESDLFGRLAPEDRELLARHLLPVSFDHGDTLLREGDIPEALFLLASGTVELTKSEAARARLVLRMSPGDSVGLAALITATPSSVTATALTPIMAHRLDKAGIGALVVERPDIAVGLEALARRGQSWLSREAATHEDTQIAQPEVFLLRLRAFLNRLNT